MQRWNHGPQPRSICNKTHPQARQTGKHDDLPQTKSHTNPEPWEFFTGDLGVNLMRQNSSLLSAIGGWGRNCDPLVIAKGFTFGHIEAAVIGFGI
jgi:hypothetical protein